MPTIAQSQQVDRATLSPVEATMTPAPAVPPPPSPVAPSPMMVCSLPNSAASFDAYTRQFYGRTPLPQTRILPVAPASTEGVTGAIAQTASGGSYTVININPTGVWAPAETPGGAQDGLNATFTLLHAPSPPGDLMLSKNGVLLAQGVAYTLAGNILTFLPGYIPALGDVLRAYPYRF